MLPRQPAEGGGRPTGCSGRKLLRTLDFLVNDILVILFSFSDIILDVLVCLEFYRQGHMLFFYLSLAIFLLAQLTYSFLFVATWGKHLSPLHQMLVFIIVVPVSQLVPVFTWVESLRLPRLDALLTAVGLRPTGDPLGDQGGEEEDHDMLWSYIQHKYQSHAGFLAEALAEALPQCMLQTIAVISLGEASPVFLVSILTSILVIASKGYLISYSIHSLTFFFNFICIVTDVFGLFAILSWLSSADTGPEDIYNRIYTTLLAAGWVLLAGGGLCLVLYSMFDDHLKLRRLPHPEGRGEDLWFHLYTVRALAWLLAVVPVCVLFLSARLSLLPVAVLQSLDPEHAQRWRFYSALYRFLSLPGGDARVLAANRFFAQCHADKKRLVRDLHSYGVNREPGGQLRDRADRLEKERSALQTWLGRVGSFPELAWSASPQDTAEEEEEPVDHTIVMSAIVDTEGEEAARRRIRRALARQAVEARLGATGRQLVKRSALFRMLLYSAHAELAEGLILVDRVIMALGMVFMTVGLLCAALFAPVFIVFVFYALVYPIIQLSVHLAAGRGVSLLAYTLTLVYIFLLSVLAALAPFVYRFQSLRVDVIDIRHFPGVFYELPTLRELHRRFVLEVDRRIVATYMDAKFGRDMVREIYSYV